MARAAAILLSVSLLTGVTCQAQTINWYSSPATNRTSTGALMTAGFSFELGAFKDGFVPTAANTVMWASKWVPAQRVTYNVSGLKYEGSFTVYDNAAPFTLGDPAYVWGFQGGVASSEWILLRKSTSPTPWTWPVESDPMSPVPTTVVWNASTATAIVGSINANGSPYLMQSAAITSWSQWQATELNNEPLNGPNDDPDKDGTPNQLEFVFGTPPKQAGAPPQTPVTKVDGHLQITIPRRIDHSAVLVVEVSSDLTTWNSGPGHTEVVSNTPAALVVRDLTPQDAAHPRRFMRLKTGLPTP